MKVMKPMRGIGNAGKIVASVGAAGVSIGMVGASTAAVSAGTVIVATGGAAALALAGYGVYRMLSSRERS
ncbi:MAG: hypothetical protein RL199_412 [Pseudomonadota bacterium]|jgi:hypothetical protein